MSSRRSLSCFTYTVEQFFSHWLCCRVLARDLGRHVYALVSGMAYGFCSRFLAALTHAHSRTFATTASHHMTSGTTMLPWPPMWPTSSDSTG